MDSAIFSRMMLLLRSRRTIASPDAQGKSRQTVDFARRNKSIPLGGSVIDRFAAIPYVLSLA
ncbi:MAG: hypothetical protein E5W99_07545 [Mesorhizobium sp.]|nr:MAG: hypothetical protein E5X10_17055 [Mesorhizobium sp.]TIS93755.1 MAG: hypothetical protein E5W99_07545 [Mesorhizobium sp.]